MRRAASRARSWAPVVWGLLTAPSLWAVALAQMGRLARPGWWRRRPWLPIPDRSYLLFRLETAYGCSRVPDVEDVLDYLRWCKSQRLIGQ
ncbi:MAG: hypothetical protein ACRDV9_06690 [Acidimicrobiia bacterium]